MISTISFLKPSEEVDEDDPKLLAELEAFVSDDGHKRAESDSTAHEEPSGVSSAEVQERISAYKSSIQILKSTQPSNTSHLRRLERTLQLLDSLASQVAKGQIIQFDELPPPPPPIPHSVTLREPQNPATTAILDEPTQPAADKKVDDETAVTDPSASPLTHAVTALKSRCQEYKLAAIKARDSGQIPRAKELLNAAKFIEEMLPKVASGEEQFDPETDMPPPPDQFITSVDEPEAPAADESMTSRNPPRVASSPPIPQVMMSPVVTIENVRLRADYYKALLVEARKDPAESAKARRLARILTLYENGIKAVEHGVTAFNYNELPPPPNCPPLSTLAVKHAEAVPKSTISASSSDADKKQRMVTLLKARQTELKTAALKAKETGNMDLARTHLRAAHSIVPMIQSIEAGIPIDLSQLPKSPSATGSPGIGGSSDHLAGLAYKGPVLTGITCDPPRTFELTLSTTVDKHLRQQVLSDQFREQAREAEKLAARLTQVGFGELAGKMTELAQISYASLKAVRSDAPYYFEWANLPQLNVNHDLADRKLEVCVLRGFVYPIPPDVAGADKLDTQVEVQLPIPSSDNPQKHSTEWVKRTRDPDYSNTVSLFDVDTKSRSFQFLVKNNRGLRASVFYSRGLFKSARLLGTANFPLKDLLQSATISPIADLMEGRKAVGGRLQIRVRQRSSGSGPQVIACRKPWLCLSFPKSVPPSVKHVSPKTMDHEMSGSRPSPDMRVSADSHREHSPRTVAVSVDNRNESVSSGDSRHHQSSYKLYSLAVLKSDKTHTEQHLRDPQLAQVDRDKYEHRLRVINELIEGLQHRLLGPDASTNLKAYVNELNALADETDRKYRDAKCRGAESDMVEYKRRLELILGELDYYQKRSRA
ncbi:coiled-coil and C2 domain-containing protein 1 [Paragonimus westermani]|uniref:Coiled-coil and C2 domain-containing protein 1 n=1 Tax=Paragonimus westermani TaxID=34504 RepID=A0A5J4NFP6_9TREM|nr:coiled-coil and C2 domain-containing protein 1 [Paragonimus westermani]